MGDRSMRKKYNSRAFKNLVSEFCGRAKIYTYKFQVKFVEGQPFSTYDIYIIITWKSVNMSWGQVV